MNRKSAPKVRNGRVQKKNNWDISSCFCDTILCECILRKKPGKGYRHLLTRSDVWRFLQLLPHREQVLEGLEAIVLAPGDPDIFGYHVPGKISICAWPEELWITLDSSGYKQERRLLDALGVACESTDGGVRCQFTERQARAHQLLGTLLHELGHHHDQMTTKAQLSASRGEDYAFMYQRAYGRAIWERYEVEFGPIQATE
jgi:hypothetical protein